MSTKTGDSSPMSGVRPRIVDVAAASGFSPSLVSRVLAGKGEVTAATRERILHAARTLGYERHRDPRGRPRVQGQLIDLTLEYFDTPWAAEVISGAWNAAAPLGFDLMLTTERDAPEKDWVQRTQAGGVAGAIVGLIRPTVKELSNLAQAGIPVVLLDPRADTQGQVASVGTSDRQGGFEAGAHLAATGAEQFVMLVGTPQYRFGRARMEGFVDAISQHAPAAPVDVLSIEWSFRAAIDAVVPLLTSSTVPIGIFACNDTMAAGAYAAAERVGRLIPHEVRIVGFDDDPTSRLMSPPMTTVRFPLREAAEAAVKLIVGARRGFPLPPERVEIPSRLIVRGSTLEQPKE